ncbi:MAG: (2Fe-2S)-binding protein [Clostridiales bacterium]|jgi:Fe-S-cluster-containing hydrogenase component 2|nr:(2Fe-2S)-binding protein [Clostridiales bacterium]
MAEQAGVALDGYPSYDEIRSCNGWAGDARFERGPVAVIECVQPIPCNPCESACPMGAISIGEPITNIPRLAAEKCTGCGLCAPACPGLAIFIVDKSIGGGYAAVSFPFEYCPLPQKGDVVQAVGRDGCYICDAVVQRAHMPAKSDHTALVRLRVPLEHADAVRGMARIGHEGAARRAHGAERATGAQPAFSDAPGVFSASAPNKTAPDDVLVCRCEEVAASDIRRAAREMKGASITEVKRRVRCGMGLCQGKSCGTLAARIISEETGLARNCIEPATDRPPVRPVTFGELAAGLGGGLGGGLDGGIAAGLGGSLAGSIGDAARDGICDGMGDSLTGSIAGDAAGGGTVGSIGASLGGSICGGLGGILAGSIGDAVCGGTVGSIGASLGASLGDGIGGSIAGDAAGGGMDNG